jgi:hypothetical protein
MLASTAVEGLPAHVYLRVFKFFSFQQSPTYTQLFSTAYSQNSDGQTRVGRRVTVYVSEDPAASVRVRKQLRRVFWDMTPCNVLYPSLPDYQRKLVRLPQGDYKLFSSQKRGGRHWNPSSLLLMGTGSPFPGVKRPRREADHSSSSSVQVKNE